MGKGFYLQLDYPLTFSQLRQSLLVQGSGEHPDWDTSWRFHLINQCEIMVHQLWRIGITEIYLDGSFVEEKSHPNDIDGYFVCDAFYLASGDLERDLNALDPYKIISLGTKNKTCLSWLCQETTSYVASLPC